MLSPKHFFVHPFPFPFFPLGPTPFALSLGPVPAFGFTNAIEMNGACTSSSSCCPFRLRPPPRQSRQSGRTMTRQHTQTMLRKCSESVPNMLRQCSNKKKSKVKSDPCYNATNNLNAFSCFSENKKQRNENQPFFPTTKKPTNYQQTKQPFLCLPKTRSQPCFTISPEPPS